MVHLRSLEFAQPRSQTDRFPSSLPLVFLLLFFVKGDAELRVGFPFGFPLLPKRWDTLKNKIDAQHVFSARKSSVKVLRSLVGLP